MKLLGTTEQDTAKIAIAEMGLPINPEEFHEKFSVLCQSALLNAPLFAGIINDPHIISKYYIFHFRS